MDADERAGQEADEAVHVLDGEARPAAQARTAREREAEDDACREEREREHPAGADGVPGGRHAASGRESRHSPFVTTTSRVRKRPARPRSSSQSGPSSESRNAALAPTSAARQVGRRRSPRSSATPQDDRCAGRRGGAGRRRRAASAGAWSRSSPHRRSRAAPSLRAEVRRPPRPRTATSPPVYTNPSPARSASASSTASALTTPFRSSRTGAVVRARGRRGAPSAIDPEPAARSGGHRDERSRSGDRTLPPRSRRRASDRRGRRSRPRRRARLEAHARRAARRRRPARESR